MVKITAEANTKEELDEYMLQHAAVFDYDGFCYRVEVNGIPVYRTTVELKANARGAGRKKAGQEVSLEMVNIMKGRGETNDQIAKFYGISRKTLYLRIKELEEQEHNNQ